MLRVVVDTNVIVSALITKKTSPAVATLEIYNLIKSENILLVTSQVLLDELEEVLSRNSVTKLHKLPDEKMKEIINELAETSLIVSGLIKLSIIKDDPDDDRILECAVEGNADYIVSGDPHLLKLQEYENIPIISPRTFIEEFKKK